MTHSGILEFLFTLPLYVIAPIGFGDGKLPPWMPMWLGLTVLGVSLGSAALMGCVELWTWWRNRNAGKGY